MSYIDIANVHRPRCSASRTALRGAVRWAYLPVMWGGFGAGAVGLVATDAPKWLLGALLVAAIATATLAERVAPYEPAWNRSRGDVGRDVLHAVVNEGAQVVSVLVLPGLVALVGTAGLWPDGWPFWLQVVVALVVLDAGLTVGHRWSHVWAPLWRLHATHHSVERFYGVNGLVKHPLHQLFETALGTTPLVLVGLPVDVATALGACVVIQLLVQHSNVDYHAGAVRWLVAVNQVHRFHHLRWPGVGDVNFGLFLTVWDRLLGTAVWDPSKRFDSTVLGIAAEPDYPVGYAAQLVRPFRSITAVDAPVPEAWRS